MLTSDIRCHIDRSSDVAGNAAVGFDLRNRANIAEEAIPHVVTQKKVRRLYVAIDEPFGMHVAKCCELITCDRYGLVN